MQFPNFWALNDPIQTDIPLESINQSNNQLIPFTIVQRIVEWDTSLKRICPKLNHLFFYRKLHSPWLQLDKAELKSEIESFIVAAQDKDLMTNSSLTVERKPHYFDLILLKKNGKECLIIDIAIPEDHLETIKKIKKKSKYAKVKLELLLPSLSLHWA